MRCFVPNCKNGDKNRPHGVTFHKIPQSMANRWLRAIRRNENTLIVHQKICSEHFVPDNFFVGNRKIIKPGVIPTRKMDRKLTLVNSRTNSSTSPDPMLQQDDNPFSTLSTPDKSAERRLLFYDTDERFPHESDDLPKQICNKYFEATDLMSATMKIEQIDEIVNGSYELDLQIKTESASGSEVEMDAIGLKHEADVAFLNNDLEYLQSVSSIPLEVKEERIQFNVVEPYNCEKCDITYYGLASYETHCKIKHNDFSENSSCIQSTDEPVFIGSGTSAATLKKLSKDHFMLEQDIKPHHTLFKCDTCPKTFTKKLALYMHQKLHTFVKAQYKSNIRSKSFVSPKCIDQHVASHCKKKAHTKQNAKTGTREMLFECDDCDYTSTRKHHFINHVMVHIGEKPFKCDVCAYRCVTRKQMKVHMMSHRGEKPLKCDLCDCRFTTKKTMREHVLVHTVEKPLKCDMCDCRFRTEKNLQDHTFTHSGDKRFKCNVRDFSSVHHQPKTPEKPYRCEVCDYVCSQKTLFAEHLMSHTGREPVQCDVCGFYISGKSNLLLHKRTHTGEKPFNCHICRYGCSFKPQMDAHLLTHAEEEPKKKCDIKSHDTIHTGEIFTPFSCAICHFSSKTERSLRQHMMKHTWGKPSMCEVCGFSCTSKAYLKQHLKSHAMEKLFKCDVCDYSCITKIQMEQHNLVHTRNKTV